MKLNNKGLENKNAWEAAGYALPQYDREAVAARTKQNPFWIHFGAGNIFRAFQANVVQDLLNKGDLDRGLVVAEGYDYEIVEKMNHPHDDYSILVTLKANGTVEKTVVVMRMIHFLDNFIIVAFRLPADGNFYHHRKGLQPLRF